VPEPAPNEEARMAVARLYGILDRVTVEDRSLFVARWVEKREVAEVAKMHGLSLSTGKRRLARALARITKKMESDTLLAPYVDTLIAREGNL
jgi:RNA polymerase sigma-70 factor (ECF subfamily)